MSESLSFGKCLAFIGAQLEADSRTGPVVRRERQHPAITVSRQTGAGGKPIAASLAEYLQRHGPKTQRPWTVFDKNLVEQVLADHKLPREIARYMPEDKISQISYMVEELLGLHPSSWTLLHQTIETILHLAQIGNVILVGRAANVVTTGLEHVFHVRLVGSEEKRVKLVEDYYSLGHKAAVAFMRKEDRARERFVKKHFGKDINDPLLYDLTINTDRVSFEEATRLIGETVIHKYY